MTIIRHTIYSGIIEDYPMPSGILNRSYICKVHGLLSIDDLNVDMKCRECLDNIPSLKNIPNLLNYDDEIFKEGGKDESII